MNNDDRITEHDRLSRWQGALNRPTFVGLARNPVCGDEIWLDLEVVQDSIRQARFHGQGCVVSKACASMLCKGIEGKSVDELFASTAEQVMDFAIGNLPRNQQRCALTAWEALFQALHETAQHSKAVQLPCNCDEGAVGKSPNYDHEPQ